MAKRRREQGEGHVFERKDRPGTYGARISNGFDAEGKRRVKTVYGRTKEEVLKKLIRLQNQKLDGTLCKPSKMTVAHYLDSWLEDVVRLNRRPSTYASYKKNVDKHISPRIGRIKLTDLTPDHVQNLYSSMEKAGCSARLRQLVHAILRRALSVAVRKNRIARNVCDAVDRPKAPRPEIHPLTPDQAVLLLEAAKGDRLEALYVLAVTAGMRQGELLGLQWTDIDLENTRIAVRRTIQELDGKFVVGEPKSTKGKRVVNLTKIAAKALRAHRKQMNAEGKADLPWLFVKEDGGHMDRQQIRKRLRALLKKAGLPIVRFHDLRHTSATMSLAQGTHPKIVQERLGHSTISITLDTYSHVLPSMQEQEALEFDTMLAKAKRKNARKKRIGG
jgi:integrase